MKGSSEILQDQLKLVLAELIPEQREHISQEKSLKPILQQIPKRYWVEKIVLVGEVGYKQILLTWLIQLDRDFLENLDASIIENIPRVAWQEALRSTDIVATRLLVWLTTHNEGLALLDIPGFELLNEFPVTLMIKMIEFKEGCYASPLELLIESDKGKLILWKLGSDYLTSIPIQFWFQPRYFGKYKGSSALFSLLETASGILILDTLGIDIVKKFPDQVWFDQYSDGCEVYTPLIWFLRTILSNPSPTLSFLKEYSFLNCIPHEVWFEKCHYLSSKSKFFGATPLHWLLSDNGYSTFKVMGSLNKSFFEAIPKDLWGAYIKDGKLRGKTLLEIICGGSHRGIFHKLGPESIKEIPKDAWITQSELDDHSGVTPFFWLVGGILEPLIPHIFDINFFKSIPLKYWVLELRSGRYTGTTALFWIVTNGKYSCEVLYDMGPDFLKSVPDKFWNKRLDFGEYSGQSPVGWLTTNEYGIKILKILGEDFLKRVPHKNWQPVSSDGLTPLLYLASTPSGRQMIKAQGPSYHDKVDYAAWLHFGIKGPLADTTVLSWLASTTDGIEVLVYFGANFISRIFSESWSNEKCLLKNQMESMNPKATELYWCSYHLNGIKVLKMLPLDELEPAQWSRVHNLSQFKGATPLYWLTQHIKNHAVLRDLLANHSKYLASWPVEMWFDKVYNPEYRLLYNQLFNNTFPFLNLTMTASGRRLLFKIEENYIRYQHGEQDVKNSLMLWLTCSPEHCDYMSNIPDDFFKEIPVRLFEDTQILSKSYSKSSFINLFINNKFAFEKMIKNRFNSAWLSANYHLINNKKNDLSLVSSQYYNHPLFLIYRMYKLFNTCLPEKKSSLTGIFTPKILNKNILDDVCCLVSQIDFWEQLLAMDAESLDQVFDQMEQFYLKHKVLLSSLKHSFEQVFSAVSLKETHLLSEDRVELNESDFLDEERPLN